MRQFQEFMEKKRATTSQGQDKLSEDSNLPVQKESVLYFSSPPGADRIMQWLRKGSSALGLIRHISWRETNIRIPTENSLTRTRACLVSLTKLLPNVQRDMARVRATSWWTVQLNLF